MSEQEKKRQRIYDLLNAETNAKVYLSTVYKGKKNILQKNIFLRKRVSGGLNNKRKEGFFTALATMIKKNPTTPIRKYANELKVHEKTVGTAIKRDFSPDLNPLAYATQRSFENKTNTTSHPNVGLLKTAIQREQNKMSE